MVPIIMHNEGKQTQKWSQIYSQDTKEQSIPVITAWQLNERMLLTAENNFTLSGKNVMIAAHGNSLRYIIMCLDKLTSEEVISLELSTGIPMLYILKKGKSIRRGSPIGPSEAGVYAYTRSLALYRQKLDEMVCNK
ncbi:hypothetical protein C4D60_Mb09t11890 [Musa balbisiana]|uniref:Uncharacterized protein n=1 Tax=Musa balbisiana TaxID=52838 RepID=A0A4S8IH30_MUSBA|nr:hypothetical protein C4D60_Mb09t11890 [Musa balbisiana]